MHQKLKSNESINKIKKRVNYLAPRYGRDPDDLFQDVMVFLLEHPNSKAGLKQIIIDILRRDSGRNKTKNYEARRNFLNANSINDVKEHLLGVKHIEGSLHARIDLNKVWDKLTEKQQNLLHSMFFLGLTGAELSKERNVSEALVSLDKFKAFDKIKKRLDV